MEIERFGQRMISLLPRMLRGFARRESNYLSRGKITIPQLGVLELLSAQQEVPMNALALRLGVTRPAVTGLVDRLIGQGLVKRQTDASDRRVVRARLTLKGRRVLDHIWSQKRRMIQEVFGRISPADRAQYLGTLERVVEILSEDLNARHSS